MHQEHTRLLSSSMSIFYIKKINSETFWFYSSSKKLKRNRKIAQHLRTFFIHPDFSHNYDIFRAIAIIQCLCRARRVLTLLSSSLSHQMHGKPFPQRYSKLPIRLQAWPSLIVKTLLCIHSFKIQHSVRSFDCFGLEWTWFTTCSRTAKLD